MHSVAEGGPRLVGPNKVRVFMSGLVEVEGRGWGVPELVHQTHRQQQVVEQEQPHSLAHQPVARHGPQ